MMIEVLLDNPFQTNWPTFTVQDPNELEKVGNELELTSWENSLFEDQPFPLASTHFYIKSSTSSVPRIIRLVSDWLTSQDVVVSRFQTSTLTWVCSQCSDAGSVRFLVRYFPSYRMSVTSPSIDDMAMGSNFTSDKIPSVSSLELSLNDSPIEKCTLVELRRLRGNSAQFHRTFRSLREFLVQQQGDSFHSPRSLPDDTLLNFVSSPRPHNGIDLLHNIAIDKVSELASNSSSDNLESVSMSSTHFSNSQNLSSMDVFEIEPSPPSAATAASEVTTSTDYLSNHDQHFVDTPSPCQTMTMTSDLICQSILQPEEARRLLCPNVMAAALWSIEQWLSSEDLAISSEALRAMTSNLMECQFHLNEILGRSESEIDLAMSALVKRLCALFLSATSEYAAFVSGAKESIGSMNCSTDCKANEVSSAQKSAPTLEARHSPHAITVITEPSTTPIDTVNSLLCLDRKSFMLSEWVTLVAHSLHVLALSSNVSLSKLTEEFNRNTSLVDAMFALTQRRQCLQVAARCADELLILLGFNAHGRSPIHGHIPCLSTDSLLDT